MIWGVKLANVLGILVMSWESLPNQNFLLTQTPTPNSPSPQLVAKCLRIYDARPEVFGADLHGSQRRNLQDLCGAAGRHIPMAIW